MPELHATDADWVLVLIRRVLVLIVLRIVPHVMSLLATYVASVHPHPADSWVFLPTLDACRVANVIPLVSPVVPFLGEIFLLTLASEVPFSFVPSKLPGTLG